MHIQMFSVIYTHSKFSAISSKLFFNKFKVEICDKFKWKSF